MMPRLCSLTILLAALYMTTHVGCTTTSKTTDLTRISQMGLFNW